MLGVRVPPALTETDPVEVRIREQRRQSVQGTQRYVIFAYLAMGILLWLTLDRLFAAGFDLAGVAPIPLIGNRFTLGSLVALVVAAGAGVFTYKNEKASVFSTEVVEELLKVTWPSRKETYNSTIVVIVTTVIISLILGLFDLVWAELTGLIYG